jgi:hypothetical protein
VSFEPVRYLIAMTAAGNRNAIEPGTHMRVPAKVWSSIADRLVTLGADAYEG